MWEIVFVAEFNAWFDGLDEDVRAAILARLVTLSLEGPQLGRPLVDTVAGSAFPNMKELRVQHRGQPWRILFAFDPVRQAAILLGGNKRGQKRWYKVHVPIADHRYRAHLETLGE